MKICLKETILTAVSPKNVYINLNLGWNKTKLKKNLGKKIKTIWVMSLHKVITMAMHYVFLKSAKDKKIIITKAGDSKEKCTCLKLTQETVENNHSDRHWWYTWEWEITDRLGLGVVAIVWNVGQSLAGL